MRLAGMTQRSAGPFALAALALASLLLGETRLLSDDVETIALIRHGEKPDQGLGQLDCQGLNRALALPAVIAKLFGRPDALFAPDPSRQKQDGGVAYDYVRPLATIEPTAIFFGLAVNASIGFDDTDRLIAAIEQPPYRNAVVLIAWEHRRIETIARALLAAHDGDPALAPEWAADDFDSIYIVTITRSGDAAKATFARQREDLGGQPKACPR
jgi:hypothetical protein